MDKALGGARQLVFISGEPGIGKTTLVEAFLFGVRSPESQEENQKAKVTDSRPPIPVPWIGRGQCIEQYGAGEGYLPILTALEHLCREPGHERLLSLLRQHAPLWLVQLPSFLSPEERERLQRETQGATRERMLREMGTLLEVLTAETPLVLVLEDLHWSDSSTLDLLSLVARRREPAQLLVIGTYRPSQVFASGHPLRTVRQELLSHKQCQELALEGLSEAAVEAYLEQRFPVHVFPTRLARVLHQRTGGNPLFLTNLVEDLVTHGWLTDGEGGRMVQGEIEALVQQVPESSRQLIAAQMTRVSPAAQQTLTAASVAGALFSAAAVAAALETPITTIETECEEVVQQQLFLQRAGIEAWPDGTTAARYGFRHALYQELWHEQGTINQRQEWHQRIGLRKEVAYNGRAPEIAAELAVHFEQGRDYPRAIQYLERAAQNASNRSANIELISHLTKALELLKTQPDTPERTRREISLQLTLGGASMAVKGFSAPEAETAYARARELCRQIGETPLFRVLTPLRGLHFVRGELQTAQALAEQQLILSQRTQDPVMLLWAHYGLGETLLFCGELMAARTHLEQGITYHDPHKARAFAFPTVQHPGVACLSHAASALWCLGYPHQAGKRSQEALLLAQELSHPFSLAWALYWTGWFHMLLREERATQERAAAAIALSHERGFTQWILEGTVVQGWVLATQGQGKEGIAQIQQGLTAYRATGADAARPYFLALLAEAYQKERQTEEGLLVVTEALAAVSKSKAHWWEAELYRLKGELLLAQEGKSQKSKVKSQKSRMTSPRPLTPSPQAEAEAEACFLKAIEVAQRQQAKSLELRATVSLARLWQRQGKQREAHRMLSEIYGWFTEGFETKDLQEARSLLEELA